MRRIIHERESGTITVIGAGTLNIIKTNQGRLAYWISEPDTGVYNAWNKAVPHIRGEWVLFLGSDDRLVSEKALENMVPYLKEAYPEHRLVYGILLVSRRGTEETLFPVGEPWAKLKGRYSRANILLPPNPTTFQHISLFNGEKTFDESFKIAGDSRFVTQEVLKRDPLFVPVAVTRFSMGGMSWTPGRREMMIWKEERRISQELRIYIPFFICLKNNIKSRLKDMLCGLVGERKMSAIVGCIRLKKQRSIDRKNGFKKCLYL